MASQGMKKYTVYRWRNKVNGKCYIGITTVADKRKQLIQEYCSASWISQAIRKHGEDNFDYDELESGLEECDALRRERELIIEHDSHGNGYNQTPGGYHVVGPKPGEDHHNSTITEVVANAVINDPCSEITAARKYNISRGVVYHIRSGNTWIHLDRSMAPLYQDSRKKLTDDEVKAIFLDTRSNLKIAKDYDIDSSTVSYIKRRKRSASITEGLSAPISVSIPSLRFSVFRVLNMVNNRCLVGVSTEPKKRMSQILSGHGGSEPFREDLKKYGKSVFIRQIIESHDDEVKANRRAQTLIMQSNALYPFGYNKGIGGRGSSGHMWNLEQRAKITGERNSRSKLNESQVMAIYWDVRPRSVVAKEHGISTTMVTKIKNGKAWRHVTQWLNGHHP